MTSKITISDIKILTLEDFQNWVPAGNRSVMPWETFDPIPSGAFGPANIGFMISLAGKKEGYAVAIPPSVKAIHGKDIMTKTMKDKATGKATAIFVYSRKALTALAPDSLI